MVHVRSRHLLTTLAVLSVLIPGALSAQADAATKTAKTSKSAKVSDPASCQLLLHNLRHAASRVQRSTLAVVNDISQTKLTDIEGDPLFFQPTATQEKESGVWAKEMTYVGALEQPKKKWIDADMLHLMQAVTELNSSFKALPSPASNDIAGQQSRTAMSGTISDINQHLKALTALTDGTKYDNLAVGSAALVIRDDLLKLEQPWKQLLKSCK